MTEPRDEVDAWLDAPIEPMPPPAGRYERIRRSARRRKRSQVIAAAATAAAVVAGLVAVPRLITIFPGGTGASSGNAITTQPALSGAPNSFRSNRLSAGAAAMGTGHPIPNGFAATSATFVGLWTGWALGTTPGHCGTGGCLALARTDNAGLNWYSVPAPGTVIAANGTGVSQVRFLNRDDGWVFGPELWWTRDGGQRWQQVNTGGEQVISLETVGTRAFAVFASCTPPATATPAGGSGGCYEYQLYSAAAGTSSWRPVPGATSGTGGTAAVVLARDTGYLLASSADTERLARGPISATGAWSTVSAPCPARAAAPNSTATPYQGMLLATASPDQLFAVCNTSALGSTGSTGTEQAAQAKEIVASADGGRTWHRRAVAQIPGTAWSAAATPDGASLFIATSTGLYGSADGGASWRLIMTGPPGGLGYVGMTDNLQGFAIPAIRGHYGILFTTDGGQSWQRSMVSGST